MFLVAFVCLLLLRLVLCLSFLGGRGKTVSGCICRLLLFCALVWGGRPTANPLRNSLWCSLWFPPADRCFLLPSGFPL